MLSFKIYHSLSMCSKEDIHFIEYGILSYFDPKIIDLSKNTLGIIFSYEEDKAIGFILFDTDYDNRSRNFTAFIKFSFVDEAYRNKKIFTNTLNFLEKHLKNTNFRAVATEINKDDEFFVKLITRQGFQQLFFRTWKILDQHRRPADTRVIRSKNINHVFSFFLRETADLVDQGFSSPMTTWKDTKCESIYIERQGEIIGCIVYSIEFVESEKYLFIELSAVKKSFRRMGIYKILHAEFEEIAKEKGCLYISSHVNKKNLIRLESCKKVGLEAQYLFMGKSI
jgi:GNAT superfamily N-acetyltransferase